MHGLDLVEVEGEGAGHAAVEAGLQEGGPPVGPVAGPALVVLAHPSHPGEHVLNTEFQLNQPQLILMFYKSKYWYKRGLIFICPKRVNKCA